MMVENHACCSLAEEMLWKMRHLNHIPSSRLKKRQSRKKGSEVPQDHFERRLTKTAIAICPLRVPFHQVSGNVYTSYRISLLLLCG